MYMSWSFEDMEAMLPGIIVTVTAGQALQELQIAVSQIPHHCGSGQPPSTDTEVSSFKLIVVLCQTTRCLTIAWAFSPTTSKVTLVFQDVLRLVAHSFCRSGHFYKLQIMVNPASLCCTQ